MKNLTTILLLAVTTILLHMPNISAHPRDVYVRCTSVTVPGNTIGITTGVRKSVIEENNFYYTLGSAESRFSVEFTHRKRNEIRDPVVIDMSISEFNKLNLIVIDAYDFVTTKSLAEANQWILENKNNRFWIIDTNDSYKSVQTLSEPDRIKIIQVELDLETVDDN